MLGSIYYGFLGLCFLDFGFRYMYVLGLCNERSEGFMFMKYWVWGIVCLGFKFLRFMGLGRLGY